MNEKYELPIFKNSKMKFDYKDEFLMVLPNVKADDIKVTVEKGVLKVNVLSESIFIASPGYAETTLKPYHDVARIRASVQRGVLTITVPYKEGTVTNVNVSE